LVERVSAGPVSA